LIDEKLFCNDCSNKNENEDKIEIKSNKWQYDTIKNKINLFIEIDFLKLEEKKDLIKFNSK
jgi:hypothetical protein